MTATLECTVTPLNASRRKALSAALAQVLGPAQLTAARECLMAENPCRTAPQPEDILFWMRLSMPDATRRVEELIHSED